MMLFLEASYECQKPFLESELLISNSISLTIPNSSKLGVYMGY